MIDVGNDREFGFLSKPAVGEREAAVHPALAGRVCRPSRGARPSSSPSSSGCRTRSSNAAIHQALKSRLRDPDEAVPSSRPEKPSEIRVRSRPSAGLAARNRRGPAAGLRQAPARRPSLATFRDKVNPLFYRAGEDGHSCAECHGNHNVLRIAPADSAPSGEDPLTINYQSALKVDRPRSSREQPHPPQAAQPASARAIPIRPARPASPTSAARAGTAPTTPPTAPSSTGSARPRKTTPTPSDDHVEASHRAENNTPPLTPRTLQNKVDPVFRSISSERGTCHGAG